MARITVIFAVIGVVNALVALPRWGGCGNVRELRKYVPLVRQPAVLESCTSRIDCKHFDNSHEQSNNRFCDAKHSTDLLALSDSSILASDDRQHHVASGRNDNGRSTLGGFKSYLASSVIGLVTAFVILVLKHGIIVVDRRITQRSLIWTPILASIVLSILFLIEPDMHMPALQAQVATSTSLGNVANLFSVSTKQLIMRLIGLIVSIGSGCSLGLAGPAADVGMVTAYIIASKVFSNLKSSELSALLAAGAGAGIAANFNAPITAAFFAIEVANRQVQTAASADKDRQKSGMMLLCAILSAVLLVRKGDLFSSKGILTIPSLPASVSSLAFIAFPLLGILSAVMFEVYTTIKNNVHRSTRHVHDSVRVLLGGMANTIAAANRQPQSLSLGFPMVNVLCSAKLPLTDQLLFLAARTLVAPISAATGLVGGQFAPLFFIGAGLGSVFHALLPFALGLQFSKVSLPAAPFVLAGGAAMVACNFKAALMASVLVIELTKSVDVTAAVLVTSLVALGTSRLLNLAKSQ